MLKDLLLMPALLLAVVVGHIFANKTDSPDGWLVILALVIITFGAVWDGITIKKLEEK